MQESDDSILLQEYVNHHSEHAFATLVERHASKVYSVALRYTNNPHQAEEITQAVFVIFVTKAARLKMEISLAGWFYQTARLTAVTFVRSELRRTRREQEAYMQAAIHETESDVWPQIAPLLDTAMTKLNNKERHAIVLRFFDNKSMKEIGVTFGTSENAAKKRVSRAVEKLRGYFIKRGVVVPVAILETAMAANSAQAVPIGLTKSISAIALTKGMTASASIAVLVKGTLKIMALSKIKTAIIVSAVILAAAGGTTVAVEKLEQKNIGSRTNAIQQFVKTSGGAISMEAVKFIGLLKQKGQLPGIVSNTTAAIEIPWITFDRPGGKAQFINTNLTFPISLTLTVHANDVNDRYHYTVAKLNGTNEWQLQKAWCSDTNGTVLRQFPIP